MDFRSLPCLVLDLDGVVYRGEDVIAGAPEAIAHFRRAGKKIAFLTNNSASAASKVVEKLCRLGVSCHESDLITAGQAAAIFIREHHLDSGKGVFVVGTDALRQELLNQGLACSQPDTCGALLVGLDPNFHYSVIAQALIALKRSIPFIICNRDASYPGRNGVPMPGCGAMVGAIEASSERTADFEVGKPNTIMFELIAQRLQVKPEDCLVVGDSLSSDVLMANRARVASVWISDLSRAAVHAAIATPDACVQSLQELEPLVL
ncbi:MULTISPECIES: HAD-IIA family hydrolase [unclassified Leptolyngbya]|uniref:HAD-IIA family hydrolase n=1 Tax=unclassified Leptolyngbya TaxID=2650499 RepID=UPI0016843D0A|nr:MULTISPECIES: HAD-IIA family hydrolase [unclassified Leptolyngbya]MBD1911022.1 HAD-IIA family hydrolase [Leptolyngbya sp. FACHB-8]MBD2158312.1 HAD-IIA family hydrolase [Leptolyngbya sp. FACHB-16]